ncbi:MAG: alpha/beta hydrolase [Phototrophicales bacterium]|nr:MAG: alpha/beta hydrolase [Phototrophicales bacterium]RMG77836.1 MAG: alpha/beta hydrolase [Chloroflexota bacterium]
MRLEHTTIPVNGINLHVVQAGDPTGIPVILLHGFPEFWYSWRNQIEPLVQAGFRLYMPDQRGYNLSDKPKDVAAYNMDILADDIIGLMDAIGIEQARIVAHDWGGAVAWWLANRNPERIAKLAVLNIPHHAAFSRALKTNPKQRRKSLYMAFFQLKGLAEFALKLGKGSLLARWAFGKDNPAFTPEDIEQYKVAWSQPGAITAMLNWYRAVRQHRPQSLNSPQIHVPVLLIWGKRDWAFDFSLAEDSIRLCDDGKLIMIDHASHWVQHEAAEPVNKVLIDWL